jgi:hypothetical protein
VLDLKVRYMQCAHCGYLQTEEPHWLDRAYASSINDSDTGIMARNFANARLVLSTLFAMGRYRERVVDMAGGYGILTRLLRDQGVDASWSDPFTTNLLARGFEYTGGSAALVTSFEAFEHFVHPAEELDKMLAIAPNVLLSTEILPDPPPRPGQWWYYGTEHGQHIGFYQVRTLRLLAVSRGKHFITDGRSYHLMTEEKLTPRRWQLFRRSGLLVRLLARRRLQSKTWEDHLCAAKKVTRQ